jgi:hypothetical protein
MKPWRVAGWIVLAIGSLQSIGFVTGIDALRQAGQLTAASPLPLVFSSFRGLETFSSRFSLKATTAGGATIESAITPREYGQFGGAYNRRNVYGAAISYGPRLTEGNEPRLLQSVLNYAYCSGGPLARLLPTTESLRHVDVFVAAGNAGATDVWTLSAVCP